MNQLTARQQYEKAYRVMRIYKAVRDADQDTDAIIMIRLWRADSMIGIRASIEYRADQSLDERGHEFVTARAHLTLAPKSLFFNNDWMRRVLRNYYRIAAWIPG